MKSHVQVSNFLLRNFKANNGQVYHVDLKQHMVRSTSSNKLGTEQDYYSQKIEQFLSAEIEKPFSNLVTVVRDFAESEDNSKELTLNCNDALIAKRFVLMSQARSRETMLSFKENSITSCMFTEQQNHDNFVIAYADQLARNYDSSKLHMDILVNRTSMPLVLSESCLYSIKSNIGTSSVLPVSPKAALSFTEATDKTDEPRLYFIDDSNAIRIMNRRAIVCEYLTNMGFVCSNDISILYELMAYVTEHEDVLSKERTKISEHETTDGE